MRAGFRQRDFDRQAGFLKALREVVFGAQPEYSVEQLASAITTGADDQHGVSGAVLYKCLEGQRKFPPHKIAALQQLSGSTAIIEELARQCGGVFVSLPSGSDMSYQEMPATFRAFTAFVDSLCSAESPASDGGQSVTAAERQQVRLLRDQLIAQAIHAVAEFEARHETKPARRAI